MPTPSEKKEINAFSLDYDGCMEVFNFLYFNYPRDWQTRVGRIFMIPQILSLATMEEVKRIVIFNGSNRQNAYNDLYCRVYYAKRHAHRDNGSAFHFLIQLEKYLKERLITENPQKQNIADKIFLDSFLTADVYSNTKAGEVFERSGRYAGSEELCSLAKLEELLRKTVQSIDYRSDTTKISMIYSQMHKVATDNPSDRINYHFYDDHTFILDELHQFFTQNPLLIPSNVCLNLHHAPCFQSYEKVKKSYVPISGTGPIDLDYAENTSQLCSIISFNRVGTDTLISNNSFNLDIRRFTNCCRRANRLHYIESNNELSQESQNNESQHCAAAAAISP